MRQFISLNNRVLSRFSPEDKRRIGVHTCPGGDQDSTHSADIDYASLLPDLFRLKAGNFYIQLASEKDRRRVLGLIKEQAQPDQKIFVGVIDPISPRVETPEEVRDRVLEAGECIPPRLLGTTDDFGFAPFSDDTSTARPPLKNLIQPAFRAHVTATCLHTNNRPRLRVASRLSHPSSASSATQPQASGPRPSRESLAFLARATIGSSRL